MPLSNAHLRVARPLAVVSRRGRMAGAGANGCGCAGEGLVVDNLSPISSSEFAALADGLPSLGTAIHVAIAISGGADSMALACLTAQWAHRQNRKVTALTVDHGLRNEAQAEAATVKRWLGDRGVAHETLVWQGKKPASNIQALARRARYGLLDEWCAVNGASVLLLGHHLEDQAETVLLRLGRGSGLYGLAGMAAETVPVIPGGPVHARPLLAVSKARLLATLKADGQAWVDDPSNADPRYRRVQARGLWAHLKALGITPERMAQTATHLARARDALEREAGQLMARACQIHGAGYARLDTAMLKDAHAEVGLRVLSRVLQSVSGGDYGPRFNKLERLYESLPAGGATGQTLAGCRILPVDDGCAIIAREPRSMAGALALHAGRQVWDGRYLVTAGSMERPLWIQRLGAQGFKSIRDHVDSRAVSSIPATVRTVLPGVFDARGPLSVPALNYVRGARLQDPVHIDFLPRHSMPSKVFCA